ncbi:MAG TPA: formyltransferase family protein [Nocardioidaceae bacterium]|nr:formyltransferase family protein [Nocardioidaceae bacterium]
MTQFVLTLLCPSRPGIVHAVSGLLVQHDGNILESQEFNDVAEDRFFLRVRFSVGGPATVESLREAFAPVGQQFAMTWEMWEASARYMQVLSDDTCRLLSGRAINIHHSFLPSFKGARPYHQAFDRGVKLIGATAHYVTAELDEGPIIEQDVLRVHHGYDAAELASAGRDVESLVLSRAVRWHAESRVLLNGHKTVVFR